MRFKLARAGNKLDLLDDDIIDVDDVVENVVVGDDDDVVDAPLRLRGNVDGAGATNIHPNKKRGKHLNMKKTKNMNNNSDRKRNQSHRQ